VYILAMNSSIRDFSPSTSIETPDASLRTPEDGIVWQDYKQKGEILLLAQYRLYRFSYWTSLSGYPGYPV